MINNLVEKIRESYFVSYIYLYIFLMPWNFFNGQMGALSIVLLIWWLIIGKKNGYFLKLRNIFEFKPLFLMILFFLYAYLSLLWTDNFEYAKESLKFYKYYWIMIPVLFTSLKKEQAENGIYLFLFSLGSYAVFSILIYLNFVHILNNGQGNPRGILAYAIVTPYMTIGVLSSVIMLFFSNKNSLKIVFLFMAVLFSLGLFINNGRAGQLAFFMTTAVLIILIREHWNFKLIVGSFFVVLIALYLMVSFNKLDRYTIGFSELFHAKQSQFDGSWGQRAYMWYAATEIIKKNPIFGVGVGDNIDEFLEYTKTHPSKATWLRSFHNQHLDILTRYGVVGYILFTWSVAWLLYYLRHNKKYFLLGVVFFSVTFFDGIADIILLMKPYNNLFLLYFLLLTVVISSTKKSPYGQTMKIT